MLIVSFAGTIRTGLVIYHSPAFSILKDDTVSRIRARIERIAAREITQESLDSKLEEKLAQSTRDWLVIDAIVDAGSAQGLRPSADIEQLYDRLNKQDHSTLANLDKCAKCLWDAKTCELSVLLFCRAPVDLTPIGDITGVVRETSNYIQGNEVDTFDLSLSMIGLASEATIVASGGSSATLKLGTTFLKTANRMGFVTRPMKLLISTIGRSAFDWKIIKNSTFWSFKSDLRRAIRPGALQPVNQFLFGMKKVSDEIGVLPTMHLMRNINSFDDAHKIVLATKALKKRIVGYMEFIGKSRIFRATLRYADNAVAFALWIFGFMASLLLFIQHLVVTFLIKRLRSATTTTKRQGPLPPQSERYRRKISVG